MPGSRHAAAAAVAVPLEALSPAEPERPSAGSRILFTLAALLVYRLGTYIPVPGIDAAALEEVFRVRSLGLLGRPGLFCMFGTCNIYDGWAAGRMTIFALNLMPFISALIIMALVTGLAPGLRKEGERGRQAINRNARLLALALAVVQANVVAGWLEGLGGLPGSIVVAEPGALFRTSIIVTLTGGAILLMWLADQITTRGVGNGAVLIIMSGIVADLPGSLADLLELMRQGALSWGLLIALLCLMMLLLVAVVVCVEGARRRLLVQYPRRRAGHASHLPLRFNGAGVMPPIFATSLLLLLHLTTIAGLSGGGGPEWLCTLAILLQPGQPLYLLIYAALVVFFAFVCTAIVVSPQQMADDLCKHGGFVPGIRPGARTAEYIDYVQSRIAVIGALSLAAGVVLPELLFSYAGLPFHFGGGALLIVVVGMLEVVASARTLFRPPPST